MPTAADTFFADIASRRREVLALLTREAIVGSEWTADGRRYCAIVPSVDDSTKLRIVRFDADGPIGHSDRAPEAVAAEVLMHFGPGVRKSQGEFDRMTVALATRSPL